MTPSEATEADEKGSAALLARVDPALVANAAHEAMQEELLALDAQLRKAVATLSSVRSMTAALTRVERLKAERLHKEVSEAAITGLESLCELLGVRMDALVTRPRAHDALPAPAQEEEEVSDNAEPAHAQEFSDNAEPAQAQEFSDKAEPAQAQEFSDKAEPAQAQEVSDEVEPPGEVERPPEASAGPGGDDIPTENSEETEDEEEYDPSRESMEREGEKEAPSTETETPSPQSLAEESRMPPSGTTIQVHDEDKQDGNTPLDIKKQEGDASGDTDAVHEPIEPPSKEEEPEIRTRSPPHKQKEEVETPTTQPKEQVTPARGIRQSQRTSAPAAPDIDVKIDITNIRTFARTCLERINQINERASFDIPTLYNFAAFLKILLTAVEKMHLQRVADGLPLLDGDVITDSVKATQLLIQITSVCDPTDLTLVPLHMRIHSPLAKATHPKLTSLHDSLHGLLNPAKIVANLVPSQFSHEIAPTPSNRLVWGALVYLTKGSVASLPWWIEFFERQLRPGQKPPPKYSLPLVFLVLAIVVHKTIQLKPSAETAAFKASLVALSSGYKGPDNLLTRYAIQVIRSEDTSPFLQAHPPFDFENEVAYIQTNLAWVYERRRSRKRSREE